MYKWTTTDKILSVGFDLEDKELSDLKNWFHSLWPNNYNLPPHVGLVMLPLADDQDRQAFDISLDFVKKWQHPQTRIQQISFETNRDKETFVKLQLDKSWLADQHNKLLDRLTQLRPNGLVRDKDIERINAGKYSQEELDVIFHSGFIRSRKFYDSHITLGLISKEFWSEQVMEQVSQKISSFTNHLIELNHVHVIYHTSPSNQADIQTIARQDVTLG